MHREQSNQSRIKGYREKSNQSKRKKVVMHKNVKMMMNNENDYRLLTEVLRLVCSCKKEVDCSECAIAPVRQRFLTVSVLCSCKTEVAYSECVWRISANKCRPARQRLLTVVTLGVVDDLPPFDDVPPDLSFEDLERTFPRFSSLEGLGEYKV
ncbi:uncharacterized protein DS421_6g188020 [Arachis hypogaea]|nr:uncharacterized protein DS421_6g188020 [Arachis hypogaea]